MTKRTKKPSTRRRPDPQMERRIARLEEWDRLRQWITGLSVWMSGTEAEVAALRSNVTIEAVQKLQVELRAAFAVCDAAAVAVGAYMERHEVRAAQNIAEIRRNREVRASKGKRLLRG